MTKVKDECEGGNSRPYLKIRTTIMEHQVMTAFNVIYPQF
jgi:hypothetical protein